MRLGLLIALFSILWDLMFCDVVLLAVLDCYCCFVCLLFCYWCLLICFTVCSFWCLGIVIFVGCFGISWLSLFLGVGGVAGCMLRLVTWLGGLGLTVVFGCVD